MKIALTRCSYALPRALSTRVRGSLRRLAAVSQPLVELLDERRGGLGDHGAGREDRRGAGALEFFVILRRHHAAHYDHDVVAALFYQLGPWRPHAREGQ